MAAKYPAIPDPGVQPAALRDSVLALKQGFEILTGQRGDGSAAAYIGALPAAATATAATTDTTRAPYEALAYNNIIINGGMAVDEANRGANVVLAANTSVYSADQWLVVQQGTVILNCQQVTDAPPGFTNSLKVTVTTAEASIATGDYALVINKIEGFRWAQLGWGAATGQSVTLGFWTKIHRVGTYGGSIRNSALARAYPFTFTQNVADTWEYKTVTIPPDVTGTWLTTNGIGAYVDFAIACGATYVATAGTWAAGNYLGAAGQANGVAAVTDVFQITGVSMLPGTVAPVSTLSQNLQLPYGPALALCQRYYFTTLGVATYQKS